ncbi:46 kDa FK506-binding nuclear protein-like [Vespa velutina]|uniref:46 kDa FK506-binding nuclear protein-like n=1 Tax=Vespa velutina TaxID=202808 RepID=UPI001FB2B4F2|nr:46 kDa FK506-binding nuclear protein-like [Vespa velutina]XP_047357733.1 46 kDa FK506-binding nuclear protein-like [Vespa velutina]
MFWGLIMEPKKRYSQTVEIPFHLSMATLDTTTGNDEIVQVTITYNDTNYLLCNLKKSTMWQVSLDLNFEKGNEITFICNGDSYVHLTGYLNHKLILKEQEEKRNEDSQTANKQIKRKATHYPNVTLKPKRMKCEIESSDELQSDYSEYLTGTESNGAVAKSGKLISIYYTGKLKNGKKFDESKQGNGFKFKLGRSQVIKGWDVGIIGMKVGGKRQIIIPPAMGYGAKGLPPYIPGNSTLEYEIELRNVQ